MPELSLAAVENRYPVDRTIVSALRDTGFDGTSAVDRFRRWRAPRARRASIKAEYLIPRIEKKVVREYPDWMRPADADFDAVAVLERVAELAPWRVPFELGKGINTMLVKPGVKGRAPRSITKRTPRFEQAVSAILYRRDVITATLAELLGDELADCSILDIGCHCGFFSLDIAARGASKVVGVDLRQSNIDQCRFLADHYGISGAEFRVVDAEESIADETFDVVMALGILYHVTRPIDFLQDVYDKCNRMALIDTTCVAEPVAAYIVSGEKDVAGKPTVGRREIEFHPTYRAVIESLYHVGFREVAEMAPSATPPFTKYEAGNRRCFLAFR